LAERFADRGLTLALPDLNRPSFARLTVSGMLVAVEELVASAPREVPWRFIGSSLGGYVAARWAQLHPGRVDRLLLLCPGFDLVRRWPELVGEEGLAAWEREGSFLFEDGAGQPTPVHWRFFQDARGHPPCPRVTCPTRIVHGRRDEVVPVETSRRYVEACPAASLLEVDDDHALTASLELIAREAEVFLLDPDPPA
jgi:pimeloyl-ACP methyl ester carboxylesterase